MQKIIIRARYTPSDALVLLLIGTIIYGLVCFGREWEASFHPSTTIDLSLTALPYYTLLSGIRGMLAYVLSLIFTLVVGFWAAKSPRAERFIIPALDILQSIPVLGFLPGLVLALIAIFPHTNTGLELACIIMIFTGQVWNMTFSFYSSLKSLPSDFDEVSRVVGLSAWERLKHIELPFSAVNLVWNSLLSMSGGWFFLSVCEAFTLGTQEYRLPGLGAYMAVASAAGDTKAIVGGIIAMAGLILILDILVWRPLLAWAHQFRLEEVPGFGNIEPFIMQLIGHSRIVHWMTLLYRRRSQLKRVRRSGVDVVLSPIQTSVSKVVKRASPGLVRFGGISLILAALVVFGMGGMKLGEILSLVSWENWISLLQKTFVTAVRVAICLVISSLWAVPVGIWIGTSHQRISRAQPIIQLLASFPAPMLYPLALALMFMLRMPFGFAAMFLMLLGVQWYVLFNVLAGAMRIPNELKYAALLMQASKWDLWTKLYIPSVFPPLVTGWVTAAGGAWNASIVAEYLSYHGKVLTTQGLGSAISIAAATEDFPTLAAALTVMVAVVILLNRTVWSRIYHLAQTRFRLDL